MRSPTTALSASASWWALAEMSYAQEGFDEATDAIDIQAAAFLPTDRIQFYLDVRDYCEQRVGGLRDEYGLSEGWE